MNNKHKKELSKILADKFNQDQELLEQTLLDTNKITSMRLAMIVFDVFEYNDTEASLFLVRDVIRDFKLEKEIY